MTMINTAPVSRVGHLFKGDVEFPSKEREGKKLAQCVDTVDFGSARPEDTFGSLPPFRRPWNGELLRAEMSQDATTLFDELETLPPSAVVFASARLDDQHPNFQEGYFVGQHAAACGIAIKTGGADAERRNLMAAALIGYKESNAQNSPMSCPISLSGPIAGTSPLADPDDRRTQAIAIKLEHEPDLPQSLIDSGTQLHFFSLRKLGLVENTIGSMVLDGGFGSVEEQLLVWSLAAEGYHQDPLVTQGQVYKPFIEALSQVAMTDERPLISPEEFNMNTLTNDPGEVLQTWAADKSRGFERSPELLRQQVLGDIKTMIEAVDKRPTAVTVIGGKRLQADDPTLSVLERALELLPEDEAFQVGDNALITGTLLKARAESETPAKIQAFVSDQKPCKAAQGVEEVRLQHPIMERQAMDLKTKALVALPGDLTTLAQVFSTLTEIQCEQRDPIPVVLVGSDYWEPIMDSLGESLLRAGTISPEDMDLFTITDDPKELAALTKGQVDSRAQTA
jgi:predicted Rossmann-fold nucleotide-binding protein